MRISGVERDQFLTLKALSPPSDLQGMILGEFDWGRGDCSNLARKLQARRQQAGLCSVVAQVTLAADADARGSGELDWGPGLVLRAGGLVPLRRGRGGGGR